MSEQQRVVVLLAGGFEETEAITVVDILRRACMDVQMVGVGESPFIGGNGVEITPDISLLDYLEGDNAVESLDLLVVPGGMGGVENLSASQRVSELIIETYKAGVPIAAICAAPAYVLAPLGILDGHRATGYPGTESRFPPKTEYSSQEVVVSERSEGGIVITSQGIGTTIPFALQLIEQVQGHAAAQAIAQAILWKA